LVVDAGVKLVEKFRQVLESLRDFFLTRCHHLDVFGDFLDVQVGDVERRLILCSRREISEDLAIE
jgi:hypothetical protein